MEILQQAILISNKSDDDLEMEYSFACHALDMSKPLTVSWLSLIKQEMNKRSKPLA